MNADTLRARTTESANGCWLYGADPQRYRQVSIGGRVKGAHRWMLEWHLGCELPSNVYACHRCDTPACINPAHLFAGSAGDNTQDLVSKARGLHLDPAKRQQFRQAVRDGIARNRRGKKLDTKKN